MPLRRPISRPARRGFLLLESLIALVIVGVLISLGASYSLQQERALRALAAKRAAARRAESVLLTLQTEPVAADPQIKIRRLAAPSELPNRVWVEVTATVPGHSSSLVGLIPVSSLADKEAPHAAP